LVDLLCCSVSSCLIIYTVFRRKHPLLFSFMTSSQINQFAQKFQHLLLNEYWLYMIKNSPSICCIFFAIDDVTVTSVNTHRSLMGISIKDKYLIKSLRENKNMEQSDCLNCFLTQTEVLMDWKCWSKKNWQHRYCVDSARSTTTQYVKQQYLCCQFFCQHF